MKYNFNLTEEQEFIVDSVKQFADNRLWSNRTRFEKKDYGLVPELLKEAAEYGFIGASVEEEFGGMGMNLTTELLITDNISGASGSFSTAFSVATGIGLMPIALFGTDSQKSKYLPELISGEKNSAYALTEPTAGSDANSGKTKATEVEGGYRINGQKAWISNAGFADYFTVFAKIEDDKNLSTFIVHKDDEGFKLGEEELKLGLNSSSTRQIFFEDVFVPSDRLLGERNGGFKIAMIVLNLGRLKLAAATLDSARKSIDMSREYASNRKQFGVNLIELDAIKGKLNKMESELLKSENAVYKTSRLIDDAVQGGMSKVEAFKKFSAECAILKVATSEMVSYVVDEAIQIHGGMGYSQDLPFEAMYRDIRILRIYEGTNEINRQVALGYLKKLPFFKKLFLGLKYKSALASLKKGVANTKHTKLFELADILIKEYLGN